MPKSAGDVTAGKEGRQAEGCVSIIGVSSGRLKAAFAALGAVLLLLNSQVAAPISPLWRCDPLRTDKATMVDATTFRLPLPKDFPISEVERGIVVDSRMSIYSSVGSRDALAAQAGPKFIVSAKSVWLRPGSGVPVSADGPRMWLARQMLGSGSQLAINVCGWLLLVLPWIPGSLLSRAASQNLPATELATPDQAVGLRPLDLIFSATTLAAGGIFIVGYTLSWFGLLNHTTAWLIGMAGVATLCLIAKRLGRRFLPGAGEGGAEAHRFSWAALARQVRAEFSAAPVYGVLSLLLLLALLAVQVAQLLIAVRLAPANYDSLTYIMPRMAYYLQQGSLDYFDSNFVAMTVHFKGGTLLQIFAYLMTGRAEWAVQLVTLVWSWLTLGALFGMALMLTGRVLPAIAAAAAAGLAASFITISVTPQLDMPVTMFLALSLYFALRWSSGPGRLRDAVLSILCVAMACGAKASALLLLPSIGAVFLACWWRKRAELNARSWAVMGATALLAGLLFVLPSGYHENWAKYGHFMGPISWRNAVILPAKGPVALAKEALTNAARYATHFVGLDGMPRTEETVQWQSALRVPVVALAAKVGLDPLAISEGRQPFQPGDFWTANEDLSFTGPVLVLLMLPGAVMALWRMPNRILVGALIAAALLYFFAQSASSRYDPWRGRSFVNITLFLAPLTAALFCPPPRGKSRIGPLLLLAFVVPATLVVVGCGVNAGFFRYTSPFFSTQGTIAFEGSIFNHPDRIWQICRGNLPWFERFRQFEANVPQEACVLLKDVPPEYQYIYWGEGLSRKIIFDPALGTPSYLLFANRHEKVQEGDLPMGSVIYGDKTLELYLRKL